MNLDVFAVTTGLAVLALMAYAVVALILIAAVLRMVRVLPAAVWSGMRHVTGFLAVPAAWLASLIAMGGSLYLSEIAHLSPCRLCWYQRIAMYPLTVLLGIATFRADLYTAKRYVAPLALIGAVIAAYHYQLERFPDQPALACTPDIPCSVAVLNIWGFASVPFMALAAFLLITTLVLLGRETETA